MFSWSCSLGLARLLALDPRRFTRVLKLSLITKKGTAFCSMYEPVLDLVSHGNVQFFTRHTGVTGKSIVFKKLRGSLLHMHGEEKVFVTATTGLAATPIGGRTIHNFFGVGCPWGSAELLERNVAANARIADSESTGDAAHVPGPTWIAQLPSQRSGIWSIFESHTTQGKAMCLHGDSVRISTTHISCAWLPAQRCIQSSFSVCFFSFILTHSRPILGTILVVLFPKKFEVSSQPQSRISAVFLSSQSVADSSQCRH